MLEYFLLDWQDFDLPVYPIAVLSHKKRASGCQLPLRVDFPNKQVLHFEFDVIDLARKMAHGLTRTHTDIHGIRVGLCGSVGYSLSTRREALQLEHKLSKVMPDMAREKVMQLTNPFIELGIQRGIQQGIQRGRQEGRQEGEMELVLRLLKRRLGVLTASQERAIRKLDLSRVEALSEALLDFTSRADLARWLRTNSK